MNGYFKMVATGDLHFGNPRISSSDLYQKLRKYFYPELKDAHLCIITGDVYDQLLTVNSKAHKFASLFIADLFNISARTGMQVRLLHGTYSHDRDQLSIFETLAIPGTRFKIVNSIEAEEIKDFQCNDEILNMSLRVGYLPDNLSYKTSMEALDHLRRTMTVVGFNKLDLIVGHGAFLHTMPADAGHHPPCLYEFPQFEHIVDGPIVMGHIHVHSRFHNVYYCGSFERMSHGEEEAKGFYTFTRDQSNKEGWRAKFIENPLATPFVTLFPTGPDAAAVSNDFITQIKAKFPGLFGYVRAVHALPEVRSVLHKVCNQQFPNITFTSKSTGEIENKQELCIENIELDLTEEIKPSADNLGELIYQFLEERNEQGDVPKADILAKTKELIELDLN